MGYSSMDALTSALAGGNWSASCLVTLCQWKDPALPIVKRVEWASELVRTLWTKEISIGPTRN